MNNTKAKPLRADGFLKNPCSGHICDRKKSENSSIQFRMLIMGKLQERNAYKKWKIVDPNAWLIGQTAPNWLIIEKVVPGHFCDRKDQKTVLYSLIGCLWVNYSEETYIESEKFLVNTMNNTKAKRLRTGWFLKKSVLGHICDRKDLKTVP